MSDALSSGPQNRTGIFPNIRRFVAGIRARREALRECVAAFDEARDAQVTFCRRLRLRLDTRKDAEYAERFDGTVLFANRSFVVIHDDAVVTMMRHGGRAPTVGSDVSAGWTGPRWSGWPLGDDNVFAVRPFIPEEGRDHRTCARPSDRAPRR
jgi:hypothetical protein